MKLLRSIVAVVAGYLVFAVSAALLFQTLGADPHAPQSPGLVAGTVGFGMAVAFAGGLIATRLGPGRPAWHGYLVALLIATGAAVSLLASPATDATWSQWAAVLLMAPAAAASAWVRRP